MSLRVSTRRWPSQSDSTPPLYVHDSMQPDSTPFADQRFPAVYSIYTVQSSWKKKKKTLVVLASELLKPRAVVR